MKSSIKDNILYMFFYAISFTIALTINNIFLSIFKNIKGEMNFGGYIMFLVVLLIIAVVLSYFTNFYFQGSDDEDNK